MLMTALAHPLSEGEASLSAVGHVLTADPAGGITHQARDPAEAADGQQTTL
jgi:hypothetical protein